jgi:dihydrofolate synthase / folylpolyglutamate synthase
MNYNQTLDYLYTRLPMFSRLGKAALKPDLTNTLKLCAALGDPQKKLKCIHIAGTNGKGSVSHMLSAVMQESGMKTALYTSPHLFDFRERILINGKPLPENWVVNFVQEWQALIEEINPSFFEITVAMAFAYFAQENVDIAIIETGLGGRLDSTNVILPVLSVITNISFDHTDLLGDTLAKIAAEKAGIIKPKIPVVIGEIQAETERVFFEHSIKNNSTIYYAESIWDVVKVKQDNKRQSFKAIHRARREIHRVHLDLLGSYQRHNLKTVLAVLEVLSASQGMDFPLVLIDKALSNVKNLTGIRGRWEYLHQKPLMIADVAHNEAGIKEVVKQLNALAVQNKHIVIGFVKDKNIHVALSLLPKDAHYYFTNAALPRSLPSAELAEIATGIGLKGFSFHSTEEAVSVAQSKLKDDDVLLICGSFFVVAEAMQALQLDKQSRQLGLFSRI